MATEESAEGGHEGEEKAEEEELLVKRHTQYFNRTLGVLPSAMEGLDTSRMTLLMFALSGLDLLNSLDAIVSESHRQEIIDWIYAQQVLPDESSAEKNLHLCGFRGAGYLGAPFDSFKSPRALPYDCSHVAMTYTALACLLTLGDDLSRVNKQAVLRGIKQLQLSDGSFCSTAEGSENDMRFVYCACCVCHMLNDFSFIDMDNTSDYIRRSQNYDYGIAQGPNLESHGGSTFCAIASLVLMKKLDETFSPSERERLLRWCINRQQTGFQGRPNKPVDTCYSFWIGASLKLLGCSSLVDRKWNRNFVLSTQGSYSGGFAKWADSYPDPMHTFLGLSGLSLNGEPGLRPVHAALNISQRAADWLQQLHERWTN